MEWMNQIARGSYKTAKDVCFGAYNKSAEAARYVYPKSAEAFNAVYSKAAETAGAAYEKSKGVLRAGYDSVDPKNLKKVAPIAGAGMAIAFTPFVVPPLLAAVGFTPGGIAAGSVAAKLMSYSWVTGIGVSVVSAFQSVGAAGCGVKLYTAAALAGYCTGRGIADGHKDNEPGVVSAFQSVGAAGCGMKLYTAAALTGYFTGRGIADGHKDIEPGRVGPAERVDEE